VLSYSRRMSRFVYRPIDILLLMETLPHWTCKYGMHCATWIFRRFISNTTFMCTVFPKTGFWKSKICRTARVTCKEYNCVISLYYVMGKNVTEVQGNRLCRYNPSWRKCSFLILKVKLCCLRMSLHHSKVWCRDSRTYDPHVISRRGSVSMRLGATEMPPSWRPTLDSRPATMAWGLDDTLLTEGFLTFCVPWASLRAWRNLRTPYQKNVFKCVK